MAHKKIPMEHDKKIALVAHDNKKRDLLEWAKFNRDLLAHHQVFATGTTGKLLEKELGFKIVRLKGETLMSSDIKDSLAGIEYLGIPGVSAACKDAVMRFLQYGDRITYVKILSSGDDHCLLLTVNGELVAIKSGFASGYLGEGPRTFSYILQLLYAHGAEIVEYEVDNMVITRLDMSSLTKQDIDGINSAKPIRTRRWSDYVFPDDWEKKLNGMQWSEFAPVIPFAVVDSRITDLAINFFENPDKSLTTGYRRLEDIVRKRTGSKEHGAGLFSEAFLGQKAKLGWKNIDAGEQKGRANLFIAVYMAYRNPRAHRELEDYSNEQLTEFILLNHLYLLEKEASKLAEDTQEQ